MSIGSRVRKIYERRPYPPPARRGEIMKWPLPPMEWISAVAGSATTLDPARVFVAGCGVGTEAFAIAQRLKDAEVVAADFSERSIEVARKIQKRVPGGERIRFEVADLTSESLSKSVGSNFDFISCNGVLSYIPDTETVARNLARCLARDGVLIAGVNGTAHPSLRWRPILRSYGIDANEFREGRPMRDVLRLCDSLSLYPPIQIAEEPAEYIASDVFGPINQALPLEEWASRFGRAGLHMVGQFHAFFAVRGPINRALHKVLMPRSRAEVAVLIDVLQPASFHRIVLSRRRPARIPWNDSTRLLRSRPQVTPLYKPKWPVRRGRWSTLRALPLKSTATLTAIDLNVPEWEIEILRRADGSRTVREILDGITPRPTPRDLRESLYLFYLLGVINL